MPMTSIHFHKQEIAYSGGCQTNGVIPEMV